MHHSSLYHHVPGGTVDLFIEVMEQIFARDQAGRNAIIAAQDADLRRQPYTVAD